MPLNKMIEQLKKNLSSSPAVGEILRRGHEIELKNWYLTAGCIPTVIWNTINGYELDRFLTDIDIIYFDNEDISEEAEYTCQVKMNNLFSNIPYKLDVKNQARVHIWYGLKYGSEIEPYLSSESAIDMWLSATAIGVRKERTGYQIYAPYGLDDIFNMVIRPNRKLITKDHYLEKVEKWNSQWPDLTVLPFEDVESCVLKFPDVFNSE